MSSEKSSDIGEHGSAMSPDMRAEINASNQDIGKALVANLNRNVLAKAKAREPGDVWPTRVQGD